MNKRVLLTFIFILTVALSVGTIYASEVNVTDSYSSNLVNDESYLQAVDDSSPISVDESSADNVLESESSNTLSTNAEDSNVLKSNNNAQNTIDVSKTITSKNVTKYYKGSTKYTATFFDTTGKALSNTDVKIAVNGKTQTTKTNSKGVASIDINLKPGSYKVVASNPTTGYKLTTTFKILNTIKANDISKVYTDKRKFTATFLKNTGKALANKNVKFKLNGRTYTVKTNAKGVASLSITTLNPGTYKIISYNADGLTKTNKITVVKSTTSSLTAYDYTFLTGDNKVVKVRLLNKFGYAPGQGKTVTLKVGGKTYSALTDANGYAKFKLGTLKNGIYKAKYNYAGNSFYKASSATSLVSIISSKNPTFTVKSTTTFGSGSGTPFRVQLTSGSVPLIGKTVSMKVNGVMYKKVTDTDGVVSLPIDLPVGKYTVSYANKGDSKVNQKLSGTQITVKQRASSAIKWGSETSLVVGTNAVKVLLVDSNSKALSGKNIQLTVYSKTYVAKTASNGYATFNIALSNSTTVSYNFAGDNDYKASSSSTKITVTKPKTVAFKDVLTAANSLKTYYESYKKLPASVTVGTLKFTVPEFLYIMSEAIIQMGKSTKDIPILYGVAAPKSPSGDVIDSRQLVESKYRAVATKVKNYIDANLRAPNYATSDVGNICYTEVADAFARILAFYKNNNNVVPSYVTINYGNGGGSSSSQPGSGLNEKNKVADVSIYKKASTNCQVNNAAIKKVVNALTKGLSTDKEKALAIFNYVRDHISYSFYYDTRYGAVGTLNAKTGNCVDHSHLLVAMFRTAGLAARYVHGTCTFSSGSTYGHVWTQVLIGNTWTVADATSSRNSLGHVANWNTNYFSLKGIYSGISF